MLVMKKFIDELANKKITWEGYNELLAYFYFILKKYRWPKNIIGEYNKSNSRWEKDEIIEFVHQFVVFLYESKKFEYLYKIPDQYKDYYFNQIIVSYASKIIAKNQNKKGLSYESIKRISLDILNDDYFLKTIDQKKYWWMNSSFDITHNTILEIEEKTKYLSKTPLHISTKHYKPLVKDAIYSVFSLIDSPLEESILFRAVYGLFDQTQFKADATSENNPISMPGIDYGRINQAIDKIFKDAKKTDFLLAHDYLFSEKKTTINGLAEKYNIPKSTIHYKINGFKKLIRKHYLPKDEEEGIEFFKTLEKNLEKYK